MMAKRFGPEFIEFPCTLVFYSRPVLPHVWPWLEERKRSFRHPKSRNRQMRGTFPIFSKSTRAITLRTLFFGLLAGVTPTWAEEPARNRHVISATGEPMWAESPSITDHALVRVWFAGQAMDAGGGYFVISHGMGGTSAGDSFHQLAVAILKKFPRSRVIRLDWSEKASAKFCSLLNPWEVARSINAVGDQAALALKKEGIDAARTTFIGESFGNWVNARIAHQLGGVQGILALNPASEMAGYVPSDLRKHAKHSWSFHTYSVFDTTLEIAESDFWLETPANATPGSRHVAGIRWLTARIDAGDLSWLDMDKPLPQRRTGHFRAMATMDGKVSDQQLPRERPVEKSDRQPAPDVAIATK